MRLMGAVLAGGRSSRFGSDKAAALLEGASLLEHAVAAIGRQVETVAVIGRENARFDCAPDRPEPGLGPLGGIAGALAHAAARGFDAAATIGCDMPVLPDGLVAALTAGGGAAMLLDVPVVGLWPVALLAGLDAHLAAGGDRSVRRWARSIGAREVAAPGPIPNINRPEDLAALQLRHGVLTILG